MSTSHSLHCDSKTLRLVVRAERDYATIRLEWPGIDSHHEVILFVNNAVLADYADRFAELSDKLRYLAESVSTEPESVLT